MPLACSDDSSTSSGDGSADGTDSDTEGTASSLTAASMSNSASMGTMDNTSADTSASATDSMGSATDSATDSATGSATDSATGSATDSATDSASATGTDTGTGGSGTGGETDTDGGLGDPPEKPPGVDVGFCMPPGIQKWCWSGAPGQYLVGECFPGTQECEPIDLDLGEWGPCGNEQLPEMEICDGLDNDCDGMVDEDLGNTNCGLGICNHDEPNCVDGQPHMCDPDQGAMMETCNMIDDDCDGQIDDGLGDEMVCCGVGQCDHCVTDCEGGMMPECDPFEGATNEVCDDVDNDCDGQTDEGLPDIQCGVGECEHTVPSCINGFPNDCDPFEGASMEVCDGLDNDCDGLTDEDQGVWECGMGMCMQQVPQCIDGVPQPPETCDPGNQGAEICGNGVDDNCDGDAPPCTESFLVGTDNDIRPIDVIWSIDSSGSMASEMAIVEQEVNDFASTLQASGSSTALHLISDRGTDSFEICVNPPLAGINCTDHPPTMAEPWAFYHYDTNGAVNGSEFVHSSNAIARTMQQGNPVNTGGTTGWISRLQPSSHIAFIVTTDDDGDDVLWDNVGNPPEDTETVDDCSDGAGYIVNATTGNICRWQGLNNTNQAPDYTSLANDWMGFLGHTTYMTNTFPTHDVAVDWSYYSILGETGTTVLQGANDQYEFDCGLQSVEAGDEYVKLSLLTGTQDSMIPICAANWDLSGLASDIVNNIPNDTYVLDGNPPGNCLLIDPATIQVFVNGIPMNPADWTYDAPSCTVTIQNNIPVVGDNVVITYENF